MKKLFFFLLVILAVKVQLQIKPTLSYVKNVPDTLLISLSKSFNEIQGYSDIDRRGIILVNILENKNRNYKDGIFYCRYNEVHCTPWILIKSKDKVKLFTDTSFEGFLKEFIEFTEISEIDEQNKYLYLKAFIKFHGY
ncbi:MAG: hypothetical protein HYV28_20510 [Ignavibacteriales bacterium]|nr:hypothetical protein [Ignavibacteriales bacterium]